MHKVMLSAAAATMSVVANCARAQSVNVEIDTATGTAGAGVPVVTLAGPGASAGMWNRSVAGTIGSIGVNTVTGAATGVRFTRSVVAGAVAGFGFNNVNTSGDYELLLDDGDSFSVNQAVMYTFENLVPGTYEVYTCAIAPDSAVYRTSITVAGAAEGAQSIGGTMPVNAFALGITHARHTVTVGAAGSLQITASSASATANFGTVNGIQVKQINTARVYVRTRTGTGDGLTWPSAFGTLTEALNYAETHASVREIWVGQGTYTPSTRWITGDPRSARFNLVNNCAVIGGFAGTELSLAERGDPAGHPTILSGNIGSAGSSADNTYNVVYANVAAARLNGLQISDAHNTLNECGVSCFQAYGGAVRHASGTLTIERCIITNNFAESATLAGYGAGVFSFGHLNMSRCLIQGNSARFGAGIYVSGNSRIYNCRFNRNTALLSGGAVMFSDVSNIAANCVFAGNTCGDGSEIQRGAAIYNGGQTLIANSTLVGNGGAPDAYVMTTNPFSPAGSQITLVNSIIWDNPTPPISGAASVTDSLVPGGYAGFGNISADPSFWDGPGPDNTYGTADDNVTLRPNSPCIDSASSSGAAADVLDLDGNGSTTEVVPIDLAEASRAFDDLGRPNTGTGFINDIDMGAFEFHGRSCPSDYNRDAIVDLFDYLDFVSDLSSLQARADFNADGVIDFFDYLDFVSTFSGGC